MIAYQWTSAGIGLIIACLIVFLVRHDHMKTRYSIWWLAIAGVIGCLGIWPKGIDWIGWKLGVHYPPILIIITAIGFILIKILTMDIDRSRRERRLRRLVQKVAMLEAEQALLLRKDQTRPE